MEKKNKQFSLSTLVVFLFLLLSSGLFSVDVQLLFVCVCPRQMQFCSQILTGSGQICVSSAFVTRIFQHRRTLNKKSLICETYDTVSESELPRAFILFDILALCVYEH